MDAAPESRCCTRVADTNASFGFVVPNAQMIDCEVPPDVYSMRASTNRSKRTTNGATGVEWGRRRAITRHVPSAIGIQGRSRTSIVKENFGVDPVRSLPDVSTVATRGGLATTVGMISDGDCRWERVMFPLELDHIMTIGELAMVWPKPLFRAASAVQWSSHQQRCPHIAIQPKLAFPVLCMVSAEWGPEHAALNAGSQAIALTCRGRAIHYSSDAHVSLAHRALGCARRRVRT